MAKTVKIIVKTAAEANKSGNINNWVRGASCEEKFFSALRDELASDFEYEQNMAKINKALAPEIQTIYIPCDPAFEFVSSSFVRELHKNGKSIVQYVHPEAIKIINDK